MKLSAKDITALESVKRSANKQFKIIDANRQRGLDLIDALIAEAKGVK